MNNRNLFKAIGGISDDLIAETANPVKKIKRLKVIRTAAIAAAVIAALGVTSVATGVIVGSRTGSSWNIPTYYSLPDSETVKEDIGIDVRLMDSFSSGYTFKAGFVVDNTDYDTAGSPMRDFKSLDLTYEKDGDDISLSAGPASEWDAERGEAELSYNGCDIYYTAYANKLVPAGYELTEQDEADKASGKYVFSYGSNEIQINEVQSVSWSANGADYCITAIDSTADKATLMSIAEEMIDFGSLS